ncbi:MAG TPA: HypC/HybG/HupF family hydrogenase formation chaperone [Anaerolineales bacterium]|nr:HypC/HybG/HupF family hydrogenase formation chaperone [Anaerolineales bacterium]HLB46775.1 HypC/HybG/HupF family hydrogenase formation chaperone [Anaerolineales bacterium]
MCLGIPGKVIELYQANGMKMGKVDFGGVIKEACLEYLPEIQVGDYTIIHVGFGISQLDEEEAHRTLEMLREMDMLAGEMPELADVET